MSAFEWAFTIFAMLLVLYIGGVLLVIERIAPGGMWRLLKHIFRGGKYGE